MTVSSVYWIRCVEHTDFLNQGYIGVSSQFDRRMKEHATISGNRHINLAIEQHGWDSLIKTQLLIADEEYCLEFEKKLRPADEIGWNLVAGGGVPPKNYNNTYRVGKTSWNKGMKMPESTRAKVSAAVKLQMQDPARREINRQTFLGKPGVRAGSKHTPETIEKMKLAHVGRIYKRKGVLMTKEQKAHLSALMKLNPWVCPHCQKTGYGIGAKNRWHFDNCKQKDFK
jgi:predicted GIY-YIG superfamily endonuclease